VKLDLKAPHTVYKDAEGRRLTGVTTYLGALAKPQLLGWYASMERRGVLDTIKALESTGADGCWTCPSPPSFVVERALPDKWFAEAKRDKAADLGTVTHALCRAWLVEDTLERTGIPAELYDQGQHGLERFVEEWKRRELRLVRSEQVVIYDDGRMAYGGTADIIAEAPGLGLGVIDLKTTKASPYWPYDEVFGQTEAYARGAENDPRLALNIEWTAAWRIGKEVGDEIHVHPMTTDERIAGWDLFCGAYRAFEAKKALARLKKKR